MSAPTRARNTGFPESAELPVFLTPLVGRERDVAEVCRLLRDHRLLSLVGAGGSGKTRLAAAVAEELRHRRAGDVAWVDLAALSDPAGAASHVAVTLGAREQPGRSAAESIIDLVGSGGALLVLDNCEHLHAATAALADALLRGCPALRVLTTSRQALGITGEKAWLVPPLELPADDATAASSPAVQLFVQRASDVLPGFALNAGSTPAVAHICRRLDGLPLAIELAAARVRLLPPPQLAQRLDSMLSLLATSSEQKLPRHRTLRALIDWSYELLSPAERLLLGRLAVFAGGFTLEAAERVAADDTLATVDILDLLAGLVDKSLVVAREVHGAARFSLLETVRQYAWQTVTGGGGADALRARHAGYFVELAEAAEPHIMGGTRGTEAMTELEHEHGNLRMAMEWCAASAERAPLALRLGAALLWFDFALGHFDQARHGIRTALEHAHALPPHVRARALTALGYMALWTGDAHAVAPALIPAVELLRGTAARGDLAFALTGLATASGLGGNAGAAFALFDEAEAALGNPRHFPRDDFPLALLFAFCRYWRGTVAMAHGDLALARASYQAAVDVARDFGSHPTIGHPLAALARVLVLQDQLEDAAACLRESLPIHTANDERWGLIQALDAAALLLQRQGYGMLAAQTLGATDRLRSRTGVRPTPAEQAQHDALRAALRNTLGAAAFAAAFAQGEHVPLPRLVDRIVGEHAGDDADVPAHASPAAGAPADLIVRALGRLEIRVRDTPLDGDAFGSSRPRELLLLLLCHPDGRTREQIGLEFWPDASTAQVKNSFHVTLHRLRKALGHARWIVIAGDRYRLDPALAIDFDVTTFRTAVERWQRAEPGITEAQLVEALALYRGDFLDGEIVGDWHLAIREQLQRLYRDALRALGRSRMDEQRFPDAADAFRALLAADPLDEEACRALMTCHAHSGLRVEALRLYESVSAALEEQLGTAPARETTELYRRLRQPDAG